MQVSGSEVVKAGYNGRVSQTVGTYAWYVLGVLLLVYIFNFIDRQILSILAEEIKTDLHLDDAQLGFLYGTAFAIFYALFGIPLGRMADVWFRGRLIALGLGLWSSMTAFSGLAASFTQLAVARIAVGIGEASASPAAFSLLADYFPARKRALVASVYSAGVYVGIGVSLPLGGWISHSWNRAHLGDATALHGWQVAFLAVGLPGLLLALWVLSLREPLRGASDGSGEAQGQPGSGSAAEAAAGVRVAADAGASSARGSVARPDAWRIFGAELMSILPPLTLVTSARYPGELQHNLLVTGGIAVVAWLLCMLTGDVAQWVVLGIGVHAVYSWTRSLKRRDLPTWALTCGTSAVMLAALGIGMTSFVIYSFTFWVAPLALRTYGVTQETVGVSIGLPGAAMSIVGIVFGGWLSDLWKAKDPRGRVFVMMLGIGLPAPLMAALYMAPTFSAFRTIAPFAYLLSALWAGSAVTLMQDMVLPRMRGFAGSAYLLGSTLVGLALGPYSTGKVAKLTGSLSTALLVNLVSIPITLLVLAAVARRVGACEASKVERARLAGEPAV